MPRLAKREGREGMSQQVRSRPLSNREKRFTVLITYSHGDTKVISFRARSALIALTACIALIFAAAWLIQGYAHAMRELDEMRYLRDVAENQRQELQRLQELLLTLGEKLKAAEQTQNETKEMLQREGLIPQSQADGTSFGQNQQTERIILASRSAVTASPRDVQRVTAALLNTAQGELATRVSALEKEVGELHAAAQEAVAYSRAQPTLWPVVGEVTSSFGPRRHPITWATDFHQGVDIAADYWEPIVAPADGVVTFAAYKYAYGRTIHIDHGYGIVTVYAHCAHLEVSVGDVVKRGDIIGYVGTSGLSTGPHLHFEVHVDGVPVDPLKYLTKTK